jgi:phosphohistidine phosphatase
MTQRTLLIMRHAKSSPADAHQSDIDRPLNQRGQKDATSIAQWLQECELLPQQILASSARRVEETLAGLLAQWAEQPTISREGQLYLASPERLMEAVHSLDDSTTIAMVIAHNPGLEHLVCQLSGRSFEPMPPAAVAVIRGQGSSWAEAILAGCVSLDVVRRP